MSSKYHHDPADYLKRKEAREQVKNDHGQGGGIPQAHERLDALEEAVGMVKP